MSRAALFAILPMIGACAASEEDASLPEGELGEGIFEYRCIDRNDAFEPCGKDRSFPEILAVGAQVEFEFRPVKHAPALPVFSGSPRQLLPLEPEGRFVVLQSGPAVLIATDEYGAVDFLHVHALPVESIAIRTLDGNSDLSDLTLTPGQPKELVARPFAAETRQIAAGSLDYRWSSSDPFVVQLVSNPSRRQIRLIALQVGVSVLTVTQSSIERSIQINVSIADKKAES